MQKGLKKIMAIKNDVGLEPDGRNLWSQTALAGEVIVLYFSK